MLRLPRRVILPMMISIFFVFLIGTSTNVWVGLLAFIVMFGLPLGYFVSVYYVGPALTMRGDIKGAINHYSLLINANETTKLPMNRVYLHTQRAALHNALGDIDSAIADYTSAMSHTKQDVPALYGIRSALYLGKREYEQALGDSEKLLTLQPDSEIGYANRAAAKMFLGDIEGAIADCTYGLEHATKLSPSGKALLYNNRGTAYRIQGDYVEALSNYNLAMSAGLKPQQKKLVHPSVMTNQGILYYLMQEIENARVYFQQALDINPNFYKALAGLALSRFKLDDLSEAHKLWKDLLALEPRYQDVQVLQRDMNLPMQMMTDISALNEGVAS